MTLVLRYMRVSDIHEVVSIDRMAFSSPWPARSYNYEVSESRHSYMVVLEERSEKSQSSPASGLRRLIQGFGGGAMNDGQVIAYGGLWNIMDEAHISTIATHPDQRGKSYGELVLAGMIRKSFLLQAGYIVLEVRVSNTVAQNLYYKYDFVKADVKKNYYHDDGEDAYDMRLDLTAPDARVKFDGRWQALRTRVAFEDAYTTMNHPRTRR